MIPTLVRGCGADIGGITDAVPSEPASAAGDAQGTGPASPPWLRAVPALGLLPAGGEFGSERGLLVEDGVAVAPAGDQPRVMEDGQVFGDGAGGKLVPPCQGVGGCWFGE